VSVPLNFTLANARSPMRFKFAGKKAAVRVVAANALYSASESNAFAPISATLNALAGTPAPLYVVLDPAYTAGMAGNAPQFGLLAEYVAFDGLMPTIASVRPTVETTE